MTSATLNKLAADTRVESVSDERDTSDGYWIYLHHGWCNGEMGSHIIHEDTIKDLQRQMKYIKECTCQECKEVISKQQTAQE